MTEKSGFQTKNATAKPTVSLSQRGILQRTCDCGGVSGLTGKCEQCSGKQLSGQRSPRGNQVAVITALTTREQLPGHSFGQISVQAKLANGRSPLQPHPTTQTPSASVSDRAILAPGEMTGHGQVVSQALRPNQTGLPDRLKTGIEHLSGYSMDDVRVHYNSAKPAQVQADAYTQGTVIHVASGQEKHLPHEAWHVVQQKQGRVKPTIQMNGGVNLNDDSGLEKEADVMGARATQIRQVEGGGISRVVNSSNSSTAPVQRVIEGLDHYIVAANIPQPWVNAYVNDITNIQTYLTDEHLLFLYNTVRLANPDEEGVVFNHVGRNHWNVQIAGVNYLTTPDGSCAIHAVDLADRVLQGEAIDPNIPHSAQPTRVNELRMVLVAHVAAEEGSNEIQRVIAQGISDADNVFGSGFGPRLRELLMQESIRRSPGGSEKIFEIAYAHLAWKTMNLPKPSVAKRILAKKNFFSNSFPSLQDMMADALAQVHAETTSGIGLTFTDPVYKEPIDKSIRKSLPHFQSAKEAAAALGKIKKVPRVGRSGKKRILKGGRFLDKGRSAQLARKLKNPVFIRKLMKASQLGGSQLAKGHKDIADLVTKGQLDLSTVSLSSSQKFTAFQAFKERKSKQKQDLQFGLGGSGKASFGSGGFQVKGLGTYTEEMIWFSKRLQTWKVNQSELFAAMQERNREQLIRLIGNQKDVEHLLRFEELQLLERWRAGPFGTGVAAWARLGYHGTETFSSYMQSMPMREDDATTNVSNTEDFDKPANAELWAQQQQSMVNGIQALMEIEIAPGEIYDDRSRTYLEQLVAEPEDGDPSAQMIAESATFMQSPNPYQNEDSDEGSV